MSRKTGLVMEGGAMRGMFTAGVLDVMMENGIDFDGAMGGGRQRASPVPYAQQRDAEQRI